MPVKNAFEYGLKKEGSLPESFWVRFPACSRRVFSWKEEVNAAARALANAAGTRPLWLCLSGGIDSEAMASAFLEEGIHFRVLILQHNNGTNRHDTAYAEYWCRMKGVSYQVVPIDVSRFLSEEIGSYINEQYVTGNIFRYFQLRLLETIEALGGFGVLGGGEQLYAVNATTSAAEVFLKFEVGYSVPLEWCKKNRTFHQPYFYFSTPELCLAYTKHPLITFALQNPHVFSHAGNAHLLKRLLYQTEWPPMKNRPKYSGFEKVRPLRSEAQTLLKEKFGSRIQTYNLPVVDFLAQLQGGV